MRRLAAALALLPVLLLAAPALAQDGGISPPPAPPPVEPPPTAAVPAQPLIAVLNLESNKAAAEVAPSVGAMVASTLAASPKVRLITAQDISTALGLERQKQLLTKDGACTESACLVELSGAVGARYVVSGRVDRFGQKYVVSTSLFDSQKAVGMAKPSAEAATEEQLPAAARQVGQLLLVALGAAPPEVAAAPAAEEAKPVGVWLDLKVGNTFVTTIRSLALGGDVDLGYEVAPSWVAFLEIGVTFVRASSETETGRLNIVPTVLGIKHLYREDKALQPYWGLGLGVQLAFGQFGFFSDSGALPNVHAILGGQYLFSKHVGVLLDASTNIAQAILGLTSSRIGDGFNLRLSLGLVFRF